MKKVENEPCDSPILAGFLAMEETIDTNCIRTSMMLAAQIEDAMIAKGIGKKNWRICLVKNCLLLRRIILKLIH